MLLNTVMLLLRSKFQKVQKKFVFVLLADVLK